MKEVLKKLAARHGKRMLGLAMDGLTRGALLGLIATAVGLAIFDHTHSLILAIIAGGAIFGPSEAAVQVAVRRHKKWTIRLGALCGLVSWPVTWVLWSHVTVSAVITVLMVFWGACLGWTLDRPIDTKGRR